jgi:hypothetical protein
MCHPYQYSYFYKTCVILISIHTSISTVRGDEMEPGFRLVIVMMLLTGREKLCFRE